MNKSTFYQIVIIALLMLNAFLMFKLYSGEPRMNRHSRMEGPRNRIIQKLNFDEDQKEQFKLLMKEHHQNISEKDQKIMRLKKEILENLSQDTLLDLGSKYKAIGDLQAQIEAIHFNHFLEIKKMCREDQLSDFEELSHRLVQHFGKRNGRRPKPSENRR